MSSSACAVASSGTGWVRSRSVWICQASKGAFTTAGDVNNGGDPVRRDGRVESSIGATARESNAGRDWSAPGVSASLLRSGSGSTTTTEEAPADRNEWPDLDCDRAADCIW